jgi:hypothetical protein
VIRDAQLVVDPMRHPRAGPQRGFLAPLLRAFEQPFLEAFPIRLRQFRFSARFGLLPCLPAIINPAGETFRQTSVLIAYRG